ncbi:hypothetical protein ASU31_16180 [Pedobacter ginsenosidimutans]|uniref:Uncharacterized protein n=1 Tax=Pedobacter ginsenosidimutans TaxID=687842 RepID=A0A0T5VM19_9SPHI|nr:hypothetical protein ASU31_16180 [Pedobacter ginsenosidimutans]
MKIIIGYLKDSVYFDYMRRNLNIIKYHAIVSLSLSKTFYSRKQKTFILRQAQDDNVFCFLLYLMTLGGAFKKAF